MSVARTIELTCPECDREEEVEVHQTLNPTIEPDARRQLFEGEINVFQCPACQTRVYVGHPLLYQDMEREFAVQFVPFQAVEDDEYMSQFDARGGLELEEPVKDLSRMEYLRRPHVVFDPTEMLRYIVFRERLHELNEEEDGS